MDVRQDVIDWLLSGDPGAARDERLTDAVEALAARRSGRGCWPAHDRHGGEVHFRLEPGRAGSRMNTLRALRVMRWWGEGRAAGPD